MVASASGAWSYNTANLANGAHSFTATDTVSGVTSAASGALNVTVDTAAPAAPAITGNTIVNTNKVQLTGTAEANSKVTVFDLCNGARDGDCERQRCMELHDRRTFDWPQCSHRHRGRCGWQHQCGVVSLDGHDYGAIGVRSDH